MTAVVTEHRAGTADYTDVMTLILQAPTERPAIDWAREIIEHSPVWARFTLPPGWRMLGMRLGATHAPDHVHGWPVISDSPGEVVLGAPSRLGFDARLIVEAEGDTVRFRTAIRHESRLSRPLWQAIGAAHRLMIAQMMRHAAR